MGGASPGIVDFKCRVMSIEMADLATIFIIGFSNIALDGNIFICIEKTCSRTIKMSVVNEESIVSVMEFCFLDAMTLTTLSRSRYFIRKRTNT